MKWNVIRYDPNKKGFVYYNVLNDDIITEIKKRTKKLKDKRDFAVEVKCVCQYHFWSRYEYEFLLAELTSKDDRFAIKTDAYNQLLTNWDRFIDYLWSELRKEC